MALLKFLVNKTFRTGLRLSGSGDHGRRLGDAAARLPFADVTP